MTGLALGGEQAEWESPWIGACRPHISDGHGRSARAWSPSLVSYWSPARTDVMRCVLKPSQCIRPT